MTIQIHMAVFETKPCVSKLEEIKMMKKILAIALSLALVFALSATAFASDTARTYVNDDKSVTTLKEVGIFLATNARSFIDVGKGELNTTEPYFFGNPYGYAYTEAYETAYEVSAKIDVNSDGLATITSGWRRLYNTKACKSDTITAQSRHAIFDGFHEIQMEVGGQRASGQSTTTYGN